jgi:hypothetical protein
MKALALGALALLGASLAGEPRRLRLLVVNPGHFHAAQLQSTMLPGIAEEVRVYAPLGPDLTAYLNSVARYNNRTEDPTRWRYQIYAGPDYRERLLREPAGNVVMLSGRNAGKIDTILAAIRAGQNVLADKPWIIESQELPKLETALAEADQRSLVAYDAMTQRFDMAYRLQRELVSDPAVFGAPLPGTPAEPSVRMENRHALLKVSGGVANRRPPWFLISANKGRASRTWGPTWWTSSSGHCSPIKRSTTGARSGSCRRDGARQF